MTYLKRSFWAVLLGSLTGCKSGIRDIDFESKQFTATYNVDSTSGVDRQPRIKAPDGAV